MSDTEKKTYDIYEETSDGHISETNLSEYNVTERSTADEIAFLAKLLGFKENEQVDVEDKDFKILLSGIQSLSYAEAVDITKEALEEHDDDRNFPYDLKDYMQHAVTVDPKDVVYEGITGDFLVRCCAGIMRFSSPYPEVRSCTYFHDDPEERCETFRAYLLATIWVGINAFTAQFFEIRQPSIALSAGLCQMFVVPCGMFMAKVLPDWGFTIRGTRHSLNPGPWTHKEQSFVTVVFGEMGLPYTGYQVLVQKLPMYYGQEWAGLGYQICMLISNQFIGFGLAGLFRNVVVYPTKNMYMSSFSQLALNKAFLKPDNRNPVNGWTLTRWHFFFIAFAIIFVYEWLPLYLMSFLSMFNWLTWIAPDNFNLATVTGFQTGLGFNPIPSFDFNYITNLVSPVFSTVCSYIGAVLAGLTILGIYYTNMYNTAYLPINSNAIFTNTGVRYKISKVLTDGILDEKKYQAYSPPFYAAANLVSYGAFFAAYTSVIVNSLLYDWKTLYDSYVELAKSVLGKQRTIKDYKDPHCRMMAKYPETPYWWFVVVLLIALALSLVTFKAFPTQSPVWGLFMALGFSVVFIVPMALLGSRTNSSISTNVLVELVFGYAMPGHGVAMMLVKAYGVNSHIQATAYLQDLKYAHYAKVPPRAAFRAQMWATVVAMFVAWGVMQLQMNGMDICRPELIKTTKFTCPSETTYFSSSVLWGVIGPKRVFSSQYPLLKWCFLIGCGVPIPLYLARRFIPSWRRRLLLIEPSIIIIGFLSYAPANLSYSTGALYTNLLFMGYIRRRYVKWFEKYNYVLNAAISAALSLCAFIVYFSVQYHPKPLDWWGNTVNDNGLDGNPTSLLELPDVGYFGTGPGTYDW